MAKFYPVIQALPTTTRTIWPQTKDPVHRTPHEKKALVAESRRTTFPETRIRRRSATQKRKLLTMVPVTGIELVTFALRMRCSTD